MLGIPLAILYTCPQPLHVILPSSTCIYSRQLGLVRRRDKHTSIKTWCNALSCSSVHVSGILSGSTSSPSYSVSFDEKLEYTKKLTERAVSINAFHSSFGKKRLKKS